MAPACVNIACDINIGCINQETHVARADSTSSAYSQATYTVAVGISMEHERVVGGT